MSSHDDLITEKSSLVHNYSLFNYGDIGYIFQTSTGYHFLRQSINVPLIDFYWHIVLKQQIMWIPKGERGGRQKCSLSESPLVS